MNLAQQAKKFTILGIGSNGDGYIIIDNKKIFVPYTLTGDVVEPVYDRKTRTTVYNLAQPSQSRIDPICQHFEDCGGCALQHLPLNVYKDYKVNQITAPLLAHHVMLPDISESYILGPYQRRRVTLKAVRMGQHIDLGYYRFHSHEIINVVECPIAHPTITQLFEPLRSVLEIMLIRPKSAAEIAVTHTDVGLDLHIATNTKTILDLNRRERFIDFAREYHLARLTINNEIIVAFQTPSIDLAGYSVTTDAGSFLQASPIIDKYLEQFIDNHFKDKSYKRIADLFCGRGTLSLPLSRYSIVDGYEIDTPAIQALGKTIAQNNIGRLHIHHRNLFDLPLSVPELQPYDCIVLNPPRTGAYAQIKQLAQTQIPELLYLSCNPQTFARDAAVLTAHNYQLTTLIPIDQFHWSPHVELLGVFTK